MQVPCVTFSAVRARKSEYQLVINVSQSTALCFSLSGARNTISSSPAKNLSTSFSFYFGCRLCRSYSSGLRGDIHECDVCMGCTTAIKPLRVRKCATVQLWLIYSLRSTSSHWLPDASWLGNGATVTVSWPTRSAPHPLINVKCDDFSRLHN